MKINKNNFHFHSVGSFLAQPASWAEKAFNMTHYLDPFVLGNRRWLPLAKSGSRLGVEGYVRYLYHPEDVWEWKYFTGSSIYWISSDRKLLLRLSDHWSCVEGSVDTRTCGNIRDCYWKIRTNSKSPIKGFNGYVLGITAFSGMRNRPTLRTQRKEQKLLIGT